MFLVQGSQKQLVSKSQELGGMLGDAGAWGAAGGVAHFYAPGGALVHAPSTGADGAFAGVRASQMLAFFVNQNMQVSPATIFPLISVQAACACLPCTYPIR